MRSVPGYTAGIRLLPNAVTILALCAGLSGVQFALIGRFELCVAAVGAAALCDALDGGLARLLEQGAEPLPHPGVVRAEVDLRLRRPRAGGDLHGAEGTRTPAPPGGSVAARRCGAVT